MFTCVGNKLGSSTRHVHAEKVSRDGLEPDPPEGEASGADPEAVPVLEVGERLGLVVVEVEVCVEFPAYMVTQYSPYQHTATNYYLNEITRNRGECMSV